MHNEASTDEPGPLNSRNAFRMQARAMSGAEMMEEPTQLWTGQAAWRGA